MEELLARLREMQQQQQQLNEQLAEREARKSPSDQASEPSGGQRQNDEQPNESSKGQPSKGQPSEGQQFAQGDDEAAGTDADEQTAEAGGADESLAAEQQRLRQRSSTAAEEVAELRVGREQTQSKSDVAAELRRAAEFQENAARSISERQYVVAKGSGSEGAASIAEAIARLEDLVFTGAGGRHEADSYPAGYEQLIEEYLRAISYE